MAERGSAAEGPELVTSWDIATACDVRLGPLLRDAAPEGSYVDIDPDAISATLNMLNSSGEVPDRRQIIFTASHVETLQKHPKTYPSQTILGFASIKGKVSHLEVAIGGDSNWLTARTEAEREAEVKKASAELHIFPPEAAAVIDTPLFIRNLQAYLIEQEVAAIHSKAVIQSRAVHELQHGLDYSIKTTREAELRHALAHTRNTLAISALAGSIVFAVAEQVRSKYIHHSNNAPRVGRIGAACLASIGAFLAARHASRYHGKEKYRTDPSEIRARHAEGLAPYMPTIVRVISPTVE